MNSHYALALSVVETIRGAIGRGRVIQSVSMLPILRQVTLVIKSFGHGDTENNSTPVDSSDKNMLTGIDHHHQYHNYKQ